MEATPKHDRASDDGPQQGSSAELRVTIVIVSWNTREMLLEAIRSAWPLRGLAGELIVVDNASEDGSADAVEQAFPEARVIRNERNLGFAGGVNVGLRAAREPWILLLNTDTLVREDAIERLVAYAREHSEAGVVGPRILNRDGSLQASCYRFPSLWNMLLSASYVYKLFPRSPFFNRETYVGRDTERAGPVDYVSGCAFLVAREVVDRVGVFDESFFMYAEEMDFCYRMREAGLEVHYAPVGSIVHFGGGSSRLQSDRMFVEFRRSLLRFHRKHYGPIREAVARALLVLFLVIRIPYWGIRAALPASGRAEARSRLGNHLAGLRFLLFGSGADAG